LGDVNINIQSLLYRTAGDKELIMDLCNVLKNELSNYQYELQSAIINDEYDSIASLCHKMKSSVAVLGFDKLSQEIFTIEDNARKKTINFDFDMKINCIFISLNEHLIELENFIKK